MAQQAAPTIGGLSALVTAPDFVARTDEIRKKYEIISDVQTSLDEEPSDSFSYADFIDSVISSLNGSREVEEQTVKVAYLASDQMLVLPAGLAVSVRNPEASETRHDATLVERFRKLGALSYSDLASLIERSESVEAKRARIDGLPLPATTEAEPLWLTVEYTMDRQGRHQAPEHVDLHFTLLSRTLRLNCDIRDVGKLVDSASTMRVADDAWLTLDEIERRRLRPQLSTYTRESIAGLNYPAVKMWGVGAWTRSFGVACGVLPDRHSRVNKEWRYTKALPAIDVLKKARADLDNIGRNALELSLNVLSMFGLFHLSKNHTYKTGDANMSRICVSYIQTLRTMVSDPLMEDIKGHEEIVCRTAAHPFGLGQTYWLALYMGYLNALASPLALRTNVTPPPVQRLMIVDVAMKEWENIGISNSLAEFYADKRTLIRREINLIVQSAPSYSELSYLYGIPNQIKVSSEAMDAANSMMPMVYGFAQAMHTEEGKAKGGIALAMSLNNVTRDCGVAAKMYAALWEAYLSGLDKGGLIDFLRTARDNARVGRQD